MRSRRSIVVCCARKSSSYSALDQLQSLQLSMEPVVSTERMKFGSTSPPQPLAPLAELQAQEEGTADPEEGLSLEIFEVKDDMFTPPADEELAERLMKHLDEQEAKLKAEEEKD